MIQSKVINKGLLFLLCRIISVDRPPNFECTLVSCHLKLVWCLNFEIKATDGVVLHIEIQRHLLVICKTNFNTNQNIFRAYSTMEKVAPNSNFVCRFSEINLHSKTKGPLRYFWGGRLCIHKWNNTNSKP